jgi:hypothetical protein
VTKFGIYEIEAFSVKVPSDNDDELGDDRYILKFMCKCYNVIHFKLHFVSVSGLVINMYETWKYSQ